MSAWQAPVTVNWCTVGALLAPPASVAAADTPGTPSGITPWHLQSRETTTEQALQSWRQQQHLHQHGEHCTQQQLADGPAGLAGGRTCHPLCPDPKRRLRLGHGG